MINRAQAPGKWQGWPLVLADKGPYPTLMLPNTNWIENAKCVSSAAPELFFPLYGTASSPNLAKKLCTGCKVITQCLEWAIVHEEKGIWGATTERERNRFPFHIKEYLRASYQKRGLFIGDSEEIAPTVRTVEASFFNQQEQDIL